MRKATAISLCIVLTLSLVLKISAIVWYELNQSYIAAELCEQKEIMDNNCAGHCQLSQKLQLTENTNDEDDAPAVSQQFELITFVLPEEDAEDNVLSTLASNHTQLWTLGTENNFISQVDHPPAA